MGSPCCGSHSVRYYMYPCTVRLPRRSHSAKVSNQLFWLFSGSLKNRYVYRPIIFHEEINAINLVFPYVRTMYRRYMGYRAASQNKSKGSLTEFYGTVMRPCSESDDGCQLASNNQVYFPTPQRKLDSFVNHCEEDQGMGKPSCFLLRFTYIFLAFPYVYQSSLCASGKKMLGAASLICCQGWHDGGSEGKEG